MPQKPIWSNAKTHQKILKKLYLFGFSGTPIYAENTQGFETTESVFGECLHRYTTIHAIRDNNVLPFCVSYHSTIKQKQDFDTSKDKQVKAIDTDEALLSLQRIDYITNYILEHFDTQTMRNAKAYTLNGKRLRGFNAIFATQSIPMVMQYYKEFQAKLDKIPESQRLKIGIIYSYAPNDKLESLESTQGLEENAEINALEQSQRDLLDSAISDYNAMFNSNFDSSAEGFQNYYKDFSLRLKNRELDLAIVVNMFFTGFDATTLNTLFVDKPLRYHGLLQAYSRTNRILNAARSFGNIICFRDLEEQTDKALALFSDENAKSVVFLKSLEDYLNGYIDDKGKKHKGYLELLKELQAKFPLTNFLESTLTETQKRTS